MPKINREVTEPRIAYLFNRFDFEILCRGVSFQSDQLRKFRSSEVCLVAVINYMCEVNFFFTILKYNEGGVNIRRLKMNQDDREVMIFSLIATSLAFLAEIAVAF